MGSLLPGTEVLARGLRWEVVSIQPAGDQEIHRLRCLDGALRGVEYDFLVPFERLEPIAQEMDPTRAARFQHGRDQYHHVLSSFSHSGYPCAPALCLAKFDEVKSLGAESSATYEEAAEPDPLPMAADAESGEGPPPRRSRTSSRKKEAPSSATKRPRKRAPSRPRS